MCLRTCFEFLHKARNAIDEKAASFRKPESTVEGAARHQLVAKAAKCESISQQVLEALDKVTA
jgi:hypothetical protein